MKRKSEAPEVVGMAFLDLICCAFGGVILLYLITSKHDGTPAPVINGMKVYIAEVGVGPTPILGMRLEVEGNEHQCWNKDECESNIVQWDNKLPGSIKGLVKNSKIGGCIAVGALDFDNPFSLPTSFEVRVYSPGSKFEETVSLNRTTGYRALVSDTTSGGTVC